MTSKLNLAYAMDPGLTPDLLTGGAAERFADLCTVISPAPLQTFDSQEAKAILARTEVLVTGWGAPRIDARTIDLMPNLRLVGHTGSSLKLLADSVAWQDGVRFVTGAAANAVPVAEYALAAVLFANKGVFLARERYRSERRAWELPWISPGQPGNFGAVVGVVGASQTGRHLITLLRAFAVEIVLFDPFVSPEAAARMGVRKVDLDTLLQISDTVSLHAPLLPETRGMIGGRELSLMRDGATIVNTARGGLIDEPALLDELRSGRIAAVLDVSDPEPSAPTSALFGLPNVFFTPHVAGAAGHETRRMAELVADEIERFIAGTPLRHEVTLEMLAQLG